jgi:serine/threonine-protein kinase RsbW
MSGTSLDEQGLGMPDQGHDAAGHLNGHAPGQPRDIRARRLALLSFAADKDHLALARMTAMHVAGLAGLPIGRVTDIRLAVDEACSLFLSGLGVSTATRLSDTGTEIGAMLTLRFDQLAQDLRISVSGPAPERRPDADDLGWLMLCALVGRPSWEVRDGIGTLTMTEPLSPGSGAGR